MTLRQKQSAFARCVGKFLTWIDDQGWEVTLDESYRPEYTARYYEEIGKGVANSLHCLKLAIDLNLFIDGKYQTKGEAYHPLGEFWESIDPHCAWGGRFNDYRHFSFKHGKRQ